MSDLEAQAWGEKPPRPFREVMRRYAKEHFPTIKQTTARRYGVSIINLAKLFENENIQDITSSKLSNFETVRRSEGASAPTIRRDLMCLSSMLSYCEQWEWINIGGNIVPAYLKTRLKKGLKESPARRRYLTEDEELRLISAASDMVQIGIVLSIETGLRDQELMSLKWSQINFQKGYITTTSETKSKRQRLVPLAQKAAQCLSRLPRHISSPYVFYSDNPSGHIGRMVKGFKAAAERANIKNIRWHDLRRTAGCRWLQRDGMSIAEVSLLLGHSSVTVTEKSYAFLNEEQTAQKVVAARDRTKGGTGQAV